MGIVPPLPAQDLDAVVERVGSAWEELRGANILITGGTGFFGAWLLESLCHAENRLGLGVQAWVLSREPFRFLTRMPHLARHSALTWIQGDIRNFDLPQVEFSHILHGASAASAALNDTNPLEMVDTIVAGTRRILEITATSPIQRMLHISSGAVFGPQPPDLAGITEDHPGGPDPLDPRSAYAEGKRMAEYLCTLWVKQLGIHISVARGFSFVGPHLPLDAHFAIGNFIRDALAGRAIRVNGDGTPLRSYLYGSDLAAWLWLLLLKGERGRAYNVGSDQAVSIAELAREIGNLANLPVEILGCPNPSTPPAHYVPAVTRARMELGLIPTVGRQDAIRRTMAWYLSAQSPQEAP